MFKTKSYSLAVPTTAISQSQLLIIRTTLITVLVLLSQLWIQPANAQNTSSQRFTCADITVIPAEECQALQDLYDVGVHVRWFTSTNPCEWGGIECEYNRVTTLELRDSKTMTALPESIENLAQLTELDLLFNDALRSISSIGRLQNLKKLYLAYNDALVSLPDSISQLQRLESLILRGNGRLVSFPDELGDLNNLRELEIGGSFSSETDWLTLPESVGYLPNLESLKFLGVNITLPNSIGQLPKLRLFSIHNGHCQIPDSFSQLTSLEEFRVDSAIDCTRLPNNFSDLSNLKILVLSGTGIVDLPNDLGRLQNLEHLGVIYNSWLTHLPDSIGRLNNLKSLHIGESQSAKYGVWYRGNTLLTSIPATIGDLHQLEELYVLGNYELTAVPAELGQLSNLKKLRIVRNGFSSVPSTLARSSFPNIVWYEIDAAVEQDDPSTPPSTNEPTPPVEGAVPCPVSGVWPAGCDPNLQPETTSPIPPVGGVPCPASGVWPAGCNPNLSPETNPPTPPVNGVPCPASGVWPAGCVPNGGGAPSTPPPSGNDCLIPERGPWPPCATAGDRPPANTADDCIIPPSGAWPACATGGY